MRCRSSKSCRPVAAEERDAEPTVDCTGRGPVGNRPSNGGREDGSQQEGPRVCDSNPEAWAEAKTPRAGPQRGPMAREGGGAPLPPPSRRGLVLSWTAEKALDTGCQPRPSAA